MNFISHRNSKTLWKKGYCPANRANGTQNGQDGRRAAEHASHKEKGS